MIRRRRRITFRLTFEEEGLFSPLIRELHAWTWSDLVRMALRQLAARSAAPAPANGVRQTIGRQTAGPDVGQWLASFPKGKSGKGKKTGKK